ncbi:pyridoxamine 5'-phosphate oxidase family protein [Mycobacteroides abscessus]|uniref:Pyridoxamine 5'-phosphate oxidase family protein n=2 Tax=Mycobacteroides abscessus TaxID=36809 RepID=A0ABD7HG85_9MYCO|nr:pyridoxamine 5'-phosphate oxidase family protein [Mycobacteroides abscessus]PVB10633.1 pyridoxamine 5'-phosphate oxidase family protein [Mycobacteroides abscessus]RIR38116.1 pyridoxamine 5'-phosphate oxidase family protein [Mycobacteroides abscessus]RIR60792.1 pyridoxamine 5'-phosphate oxidase family protein [Mycobacteroides abscessus]RIS48236.1 pyridoxamine 5'-phosphate oxidase family protein [Mycobacteroides abscessus]RIT28637.1 pyridoxamine 5'-phosphate oxidase family protein [Mycobacter
MMLLTSGPADNGRMFICPSSSPLCDERVYWKSEVRCGRGNSCGLRCVGSRTAMCARAYSGTVCLAIREGAVMSVRGVDASGEPERTALDARQAWELLAMKGFGRMACSQDALPSIRVVNHIVDDGLIIVHTRLHWFEGTQSHLRRPTSVVVAYETDHISSERRCGWSVVVTGLASPVTDPALIARYEERMGPWINAPTCSFISIAAEIVTGTRIHPPGER